MITDDLGTHKNAATLALITILGAEACLQPAYSPEFNQIEKMWGKVEASLRTSEARSPDELETATATAFEKISPKNAMGSFALFGYSFT